MGEMQTGKDMRLIHFEKLLKHNRKSDCSY